MDPKPTDVDAIAQALIDTANRPPALAEYYGLLAAQQVQTAMRAGHTATYAQIDHAAMLARTAAHYAAATLPPMPARIVLRQDSDPSNPRTDSQPLGTIFAPHRRYVLSDEGAEDPRELDPATIAVCLPLGLLDHSGLHLYVGGGPHWTDAAGWDSGTVGAIYITRAQVRHDYGWRRLTRARLERIRKYLTDEVHTFDQYLQGDVWGFEVLDHQDEVIDSCWGFYGRDWRTNGMVDHWDPETRRLAEAGQITESYR